MSYQQKSEIIETISSVAFILDAQEYSRLGDVFHKDIVFSNPGRLEANGLEEIIQRFIEIDNPARSHSNTNILVTMEGDERASCKSKAITLRADGNTAVAEYSDVVVRTEGGWRIKERRIKPL